MGEAKKGGGSGRALAIMAIGLIALLLLEIDRVGQLIGVLITSREGGEIKDRYTVPTALPSDVPPPGAAPATGAVLHPPWGGEVDAWFVVPARGPGVELCDETSWQLFAWSVAMGTTYALGKPCLDPVQVAESMGVAPRVTRTGAPPRPEELDRMAKRIGADHALIPTLQQIDGGSGVLRVHIAHASKNWAPEELVSLAYEVGRLEQVLLDAVPQVLGKLGLKPRPAARAAAPAVDVLAPPAPPRALFARMEERETKAGTATPWSTKGAADVDVDEWVRASFDRTVLGNYLAAGRGMPGPWLTLNAAAVLAVARALEPKRRDVTLASALALLSLRRARPARDLIARLVEQKDPQALALDAVARADPSALDPARAPYLFVLACARAGDARRVAASVEALASAGLPKEYARCGFVSEMDVGSARGHSALWLIEEHAVKNGVAAVARMPEPIPIGRALVEECASGLDPSAARQVLPMNAITLHLDVIERCRTRLDVCAMPLTEYARVAVLPWGYKAEAKGALEAIQDSGGLSSARAAASHDFTVQWAERAAVATSAARWVAADRMNPWAQEARFRLCWFDGPLPTDEFTEYLWDLGSGDARLARRRAWSISDAKDPRRSLPLLASLVRVDPWDPPVWSSYLHTLEAAGEDAAFRSELARARSLLPDCESLDLAEARWLENRGSPAAAGALLEKALALHPTRDATRNHLFDLYDSGHWLGRMRLCADGMPERPESVLWIAAMRATLVKAYGRAGALDAARAQLAKAHVEAGSQTVMEAHAYVLVRSGKVDEGLKAFEAIYERYELGNGAWELRALLRAGHEPRAKAWVEEKLAAKETRFKANLAVTAAYQFLSWGDRAYGLSLMERGRGLDPQDFGSQAREMLANPAMAASPAQCEDAAKLIFWLRRGQERGFSILEQLGENRSAAAVDALLEGLKSGPERRQCALKLARIAWVDLDLPRDAGAAELDRVHTKLAAWWAAGREDHAKSHFEE